MSAGPLPDAPLCAGIHLGFSDIHSLLLEDIEKQDPLDQPFTRYVSLSNPVQADWCGSQLDPERHALTKLLNMLSVEESAFIPVAIDSNKLLYRFDLRDAGWDRAMPVDGEVFGDGWEAALAANPYAQSFEDDGALALREATRTTIPWVFANSLTKATTEGNLYYALVGVDVAQPLAEFLLNELGVQTDVSFGDSDFKRAVDSLQGRSDESRVFDRHDLVARPGHVWVESRFDECCSDSIFFNPLEDRLGARTATFTLLNGFHAFAVTDPNDNIVPAGVPRYEPRLAQSIAPTILSLSAQYANGFPTIVDQARDYVAAAPEIFSEDEVEAVARVYFLQDELTQVQASDFAAVQQVSMGAGIPIDESAPVVGVVERFENNLGLRDVAAELGVSEPVLVDRLTNLPAEVANVRTGAISRETFTEHYVESLCSIQAGSQSQPTNCP